MTALSNRAGKHHGSFSEHLHATKSFFHYTIDESNLNKVIIIATCKAQIHKNSEQKLFIAKFSSILNFRSAIKHAHFLTLAV